MVYFMEWLIFFWVLIVGMKIIKIRYSFLKLYFMIFTLVGKYILKIILCGYMYFIIINIF